MRTSPLFYCGLCLTSHLATLGRASFLPDDGLQDALSLIEQISSDEDDGINEFLGPSTDGVEDLTIITSVDGFIHGVDSKRNEKLWSTALPGGSLAKSHQVNVAMAASDGSPEDGLPASEVSSAQDDGKAGADFSVIPSADGSLLVHNMQGMRKTSVKARMLAEKTPFISQEGLLFTGQTNSRILGVDIGSGKIVHDSSEDASGKKALGFFRKDRIGPDPLWIGRVDYTVRAYNQITGREQFNLTYSELKPLNSYGRHGAGALGNLPHSITSHRPAGTGQRRGGRQLFATQKMLSDGIGGDSGTLLSTPGGDLLFSDANGALNSISVGSAAVNAFTVRLKRNQNGGRAEDPHAPPNAVRSSDFDIQPLKIMYRMSTPSDDSTSDGFDELDDLLNGDREDMVVVQSLSDGGLYALEIPSSAIPVAPFRKPSTSTEKILPALPSPATTADGPVADDAEEERNSLIGWAAAFGRNKVVGNSLKTTKHPGLKTIKGILTTSKGKLSTPSLRSPPSNKQKEEDQQKKKKKKKKSDECVAFPRAFASGESVDLNGAPLCLVGNHRLIIQEDKDLPGGSIFSDDSFLLEDDRATTPKTKSRGVTTILLRGIRFIESVLIGCVVFAAVVIFAYLWLQRMGALPPAIAAQVEKQLAFLFNSRSGKQGATDDSLPVAPVGITPEVVEYDESGNKITSIGSIKIFNNVLGYGSHGTLVLQGSLNGRPVAVKRMLSQFNRAADREIALLIRSDGHPNVVRYFLREQKGEFVYLALQLCQMSLRDFVMHIQRTKIAKRKSAFSKAAVAIVGLSPEERRLSVADVPDEARTGLLQIAQGLAHLHSQRIVHRDIKPHNILLALPDDMFGNNINSSSSNESTESGMATSSADEDIINVSQLGKFILKISDMGLSKQLDREEGSFASMSFCMPALNGEESTRSSTNSESVGGGAKDGRHKNQNPVGTIGWQAPELMALRGSGLASSHGPEGIPEQDEDEDDEESVEEEEELGEESEENGEKSGEGELEKGSNGAVNLEKSEVDQDATTSENTSLSGSTGSTAAKLNAKPILTKLVRKTQTVDIFSLGCVFHYVLVPGEHPFGQWFEREANIMTGKLDLTHLQHVPDALDLIARMLRTEPFLRPSAVQVCSHPFFWSYAKRLEFLTELSDRLEHESADATVVLAIERNASSVIGRSWDKKLDSVLMEDVNKYRKYDITSVRDLLRIIRNKRHHFHELSESAKALVSPVPTGFVSYFESRFPLLLMHCIRAACTHLHRDKVFKPYCSVLAPLLSSRGDVDLASRRGDQIKEEDATGGSGVGGGVATQSVSTSENPDPGHQLNPDDAASSSQVDDEVIVWQSSSLAEVTGCRGWYREASAWVDGTIPGQSRSSVTRQKPAHLIRSSTDMRYRSRLCTHWEMSGGTACPMRKRGKCDFAHGPLELRVKENRRDRWGRSQQPTNDPALSEAMLLRISGGEDVLGAARSIERFRASEGTVGEFERYTYAASGGGAPPAHNQTPPQGNVYPYHPGQYQQQQHYRGGFGYNGGAGASTGTGTGTGTGAGSGGGAGGGGGSVPLRQASRPFVPRGGVVTPGK